jgi:hypothetical protein
MKLQEQLAKEHLLSLIYTSNNYYEEFGREEIKIAFIEGLEELLNHIDYLRKQLREIAELRENKYANLDDETFLLAIRIAEKAVQ